MRTRHGYSYIVAQSYPANEPWVSGTDGLILTGLLAIRPYR